LSEFCDTFKEYDTHDNWFSRRLFDLIGKESEESGSFECSREFSLFFCGNATNSARYNFPAV
jgi:hypothetical protein